MTNSNLIPLLGRLDAAAITIETVTAVFAEVEAAALESVKRAQEEAKAMIARVQEEAKAMVARAEEESKATIGAAKTTINAAKADHDAILLEVEKETGLSMAKVKKLSEDRLQPLRDAGLLGEKKPAASRQRRKNGSATADDAGAAPQTVDAASASTVQPTETTAAATSTEAPQAAAEAEVLTESVAQTEVEEIAEETVVIDDEVEITTDNGEDVAFENTADETEAVAETAPVQPAAPAAEPAPAAAPAPARPAPGKLPSFLGAKKDGEAKSVPSFLKR